MQSYKFNSLYVSVKDMQRAVGFYEKLFGKKARKVGERFSEFKFGDITFGLYNPTEDGEAIEYGANCVPNFEVPNAKKEYERIKEFTSAIDDEIMDLPQMNLFQFKDTEGNIIEIYSYK